MKTLPRRKGNYCLHGFQHRIRTRLNESPSEKERKFVRICAGLAERISLNESPSQKEGKSRRYHIITTTLYKPQ